MSRQKNKLVILNNIDSFLKEVEKVEYQWWAFLYENMGKLALECIKTRSKQDYNDLIEIIEYENFLISPETLNELYNTIKALYKSELIEEKDLSNKELLYDKVKQEWSFVEKGTMC